MELGISCDCGLISTVGSVTTDQRDTLDFKIGEIECVSM